MKTLDMLAALLADPDLVFVDEKGSKVFCKDGAVYLNECLGNYFLVLSPKILNANWKRKREPVDFMTAIQSGEIIQSEYWPEGKYIDTTDDDQVQLFTKREIVGKWYVED